MPTQVRILLPPLGRGRLLRACRAPDIARSERLWRVRARAPGPENPRACSRAHGRLQDPALTRPLRATLLPRAQLAQLVEHFHGKEGVVGSSPTLGFRSRRRAFPCAGGLSSAMHRTEARSRWADADCTRHSSSTALARKASRRVGDPGVARRRWTRLVRRRRDPTKEVVMTTPPAAAPRSPEHEERYRALRTIAAIIRILAYVVAVIGAIGFVIGSVRSSKVAREGFSSWLAACCTPLSSPSSLFAYAEIIRLIIAVEDNTRVTAEALAGR